MVSKARSLKSLVLLLYCICSELKDDLKGKEDLEWVSDPTKVWTMNKTKKERI